jgi:hypothetical protein
VNLRPSIIKMCSQNSEVTKYNILPSFDSQLSIAKDTIEIIINHRLYKSIINSLLLCFIRLVFIQIHYQPKFIKDLIRYELASIVTTKIHSFQRLNNKSQSFDVIDIPMEVLFIQSIIAVEQMGALYSNFTLRLNVVDQSYAISILQP